jgi:hypothetical protein
MRATRLAAAIVLLTLLLGCTSYQTLADPVADLATYPSPVGPARVTLRSGERVKFISVEVEGDSLKGFLEGGVPKSVALTKVGKVELRLFDSEKSAVWTDVATCAIFSALGSLEACSSDAADE